MAQEHIALSELNKNTLERVSISGGKCHPMGVGHLTDTTTT